jgi:HK97 gp10 family phage protein
VANPTFKVTGFKELYKLLDHLPDLAKRKGLEPLVVKALQPMAETARYLAPDDPKTAPPWDLKSSIIVSTKQTQTEEYDRISEARAFMGPNRYGYPQAVMQEFGTVNMAATPYMRPAFDNDKVRAVKIIEEGFAAQVEATLRKYGRPPAK